jgi:Tol biopolymer transport system component
VRRYLFATAFAAIVTEIVLLDGNTPIRLRVLRQGMPTMTDGARADVSADGRFVAFVSSARLLPTDSNVVEDVYVFDRVHETLTLETLAHEGSPANGSSGNPELSGDGRYLVFDSDATNLVGALDANQSRDVFLRDRLHGTTRRISVNASGQEANRASSDPTISADGRTVAFTSRATNLTSETDTSSHHHSHIHVVRLATGEIGRISTGNELEAEQSSEPSLNGDGRIVAFTSMVRRGGVVPPSIGPSSLAVWVQDLTSGVTTCPSCRGAWRAFGPHLSDDGRFVAFTADVGSRPSPRTDIVVYDRARSAVSVITRAANASSSRPQMTSTGRFVVFESTASNLECRRACSPDLVDENLLSDVYRFDRETRTFSRISGRPSSWWVPSTSPSVDGSGLVITFTSRQPVGPDDPTTDFDLFLWSPTK